MRLRRHLPSILLLLLAGAALAGLLATRERALPPAGRVQATASADVDQSPVVTARRLTQLAVAPEEKAFAHDAHRLADHEVDLAFADALREAAEAPLPSTPEVRGLLAAKARHEDAVQDGTRNLARLAKLQAAAREEDKDDLQDQIDVAKAQVELDKDELDATNDQLEKLGADPGARIRRLKAAFANAEELPEEGPGFASKFQQGSLLYQLGEWSRQRRKCGLLEAARLQALAKAEQIAQRQQALAHDVEQEREDREAARAEAKGFTRTRRERTGPSETDRAAARDTAKAWLMTLQHFTAGQRNLADLGKRTQDERALAEVYQNWTALARTQERAAAHAVFRLVALIVLVLGLAYFSDRIFEAAFARLTAGRKRVGRNLKVVKFSAQVAGALAILLILLGTPSQLTTLLGLAGAGLTVALKDFIISFFGWFILVGPKGIHVGDWVEIKGVCGEVIEIGLMRTLLLETGNWSDAGHPTGRVVSFVNSFALEGHFFNFSSSGQWMWDELTVLAPAGQDPHPLMAEIKRLVETRTAENTALAFKEWERSERGYRVHGLKSEPGIQVVPTPAGVEIRVRYVTRAQERNELRRDLNQELVDLLHGSATAAKR